MSDSTRWETPRDVVHEDSAYLINFPDFDSWLEERLHRITGSDIAKIMGNKKVMQWEKCRSHGKLLNSLYEKKKAAERDPSDNGLKFKIGRALEALTGEEYERSEVGFGFTLHPPSIYEWHMYVRDGWKSAQSDFLAYAGRMVTQRPSHGVDGKTTKTRVANVQPLRDYWQWQCRWNMHITDLPRWDISCIFMHDPAFMGISNGYHHCAYIFRRDFEIEEEMVARATEFVDCLRKGELPSKVMVVNS